MPYKDSTKMTNHPGDRDPNDRRVAGFASVGNYQLMDTDAGTEKPPVVPVGAPHIDQSKYRGTPMAEVTHKLDIPDAPTANLHEPAHFRENTEGFMIQAPQTDKKDKPSVPLWAKITAGGAAIAAAVGIGYGLNSHDESPRQRTVVAGETYPGQTPETDYSTIDIATYPHESFVQLPYGVQIDKAARYFDEAFKNGAVDKYVADAEAANGYHLKSGVGTGSIDDTAQEIANRFTVEINTYSHESNINLARNLVSGVYKPGTASYTAEISKLGSGGVMTPSTAATFECTPVFTQGKFGSIRADGTPTRIYNTVGMTTGQVFDTVVQEMRSPLDSNLTHVVIVDEVTKGVDGDYRKSLDGWTPSN